MEDVYHIPALLRETIRSLSVKPEGTYVDVTFGGGGHSRAILEAGAGRLLSFDQDIDAYQNKIDDPRWTFVHANFRYLAQWLDYYHVPGIDGLLADLGVSFHHFDTASRGFSFRMDGPLDMRMNPQAPLTARQIVNEYDEAELARIFYLYGEFRDSRSLAHQVVSARKREAINTTNQLVNAVRLQDKHDQARLFQALRIEVNDEMGALRDMLNQATALLNTGGRLVILTYHSLEDRMVKNLMKTGNIDGTVQKDFYGNNLAPFKVIEKGRTAEKDEVEANPRARSAKLRAAEKIDNSIKILK